MTSVHALCAGASGSDKWKIARPTTGRHGSQRLRDFAVVTVMAIAALGLAGCATSIAATDIPVGSADAPASAPVATLEREVFALVNRHRTAHGLPALAFDARIASQARRHSQAMAAGTRAGGHAGFDQRIAALRRGMSLRESAENVAYNKGHARPAADAVRGWLGSRGHRSNIEGPWDVTGIGVARNAAGEFYFTQIFVRR